MADPYADTEVTLGGYAGLIGGLLLTAIAMGAGFTWALEGQLLPVYLAAAACWVGYVIAHYSVTGTGIDPPGIGAPDIDEIQAPEGTHRNWIGALVPDGRRAQAGFLIGFGMTIVGISGLATFLALENQLLATVGAALYLIGYAIAHQYEAGIPL
ncbi:MAG: hypothetical protein U5K37_09285 [Natrialbaceae archaeon]|nr:hypothetical protein [Natrialbaceae archaeon]